MPAIFNKEQEEAITHKEGPLMVLAGPGSGKTLVITYRVKWLIENAGVHPSNILVITFTRAAAEEMRKRFFAFDGMENAPVTFGTFHSIFVNDAGKEFLLIFDFQFHILCHLFDITPLYIFTDNISCRISVCIAKNHKEN